ncbi:MAG: dephospho-CoA kinase [Erythrobacter sp.]
MSKPTILGLTGSIGMGKSTVAGMFARAGVPVFDADAQVRALQGPGGALIDEIEAKFPGSTGPEGVNREALGAIVFSDPQKLAELEAIVHPAVGKKRAAFLEENRDQPLVLFDIPLLFENGGNEAVDVVLVVSASAEQQRKRVLARPGMTTQKFEHILKIQVSDAEKRAGAEYVIDTGASLEQTEKSVAELVEKLKASSGHHR